MRTHKIVDSTHLANPDNYFTFLNSGHDLIFSDLMLRVSRYSGSDTWRVTDLKDALSAGKVCTTYGFYNNGVHANLIVTTWISSEFGCDMQNLFAWADDLGWTEGRYGYPTHSITHNGETINISRTDTKAVRVFSPLSLDRIKPLKEAPKKWTVAHAMRALVNGQYKNLRCNGVYTDDYARDAAMNYREGEITNAVAFAERIISSPCGWWVGNHRGGDVVSICCHHFDNNEFTFVLDPPKAEAPSPSKPKAKVVPLRRTA